MIVTRRFALLISVALAGGLFDMAGAAAGATVQLKAISSRVHARGASLTIEASEPVAYVTTRPDPLTVILDFRNVDAGGLANSVRAARGSPIARVMVESAHADVQVTRVRVALTEPVVHHVRSERHTVVVEFEKPAEDAGLAGPPASRAAPDALHALAGPEAGRETVPASAALMAGMLPSSMAQAPATTTAQPPVQADQSPAGQAGRTYTGDPVSLDFQNADLRAVLRTFAEISGLNIVIDPSVEGSVDVALRDVPWDQALDQILRANQLGYVLDGTIVRIAPQTVFEREATERRNRARAEAEAQLEETPVATRTFQLSYARADSMIDLITRTALSSRGTVQVDSRTNTLIVTDVQDRLLKVGELLATLDTQQPQVEIEARIVQTNRNYARKLGVEWNFAGRVEPRLGNTTNLAFPNSGVLSGGTNLPATSASSVAGLALGSINGAFNLDVALSALESSGNGRLLSTPRVSTLNNVVAEIKQGLTFPVPVTANQTTTVQFRDATLKLTVTPQITASNTVIMQIQLANETPDFGRQVLGIPSIITQSANTSVLVSDGQTTVIGGIYVSTATSATDRTPGLGRIPILGWLFRRDSVEDVNSELLIFITPRIIQGVTQ